LIHHIPEGLFFGVRPVIGISSGGSGGILSERVCYALGPQNIRYPNSCADNYHNPLSDILWPRAHWEKGTPVSLTTKADDGSQSGPTAAFVIGPTKLIVGEQSTWDISTMGKATAFFAWVMACMTANREPSNQSFETDREATVN
jgi:hypothetical protein